MIFSHFSKFPRIIGGNYIPFYAPDSPWGMWTDMFPLFVRPLGYSVILSGRVCIFDALGSMLFYNSLTRLVIFVMHLYVRSF